MEIIREEEAAAASKLHKFNNRKPTAVVIKQPKIKKQSISKPIQQPILLSSRIVTNTHINKNNVENFDNNFIFNTESSILSQQKRGSLTNDNSTTSLSFFQQSNDNESSTNFLSHNQYIQAYLPKRNINTKISSTFKSVVNSLLSEKILNYCKEYEFYTENSTTNTTNNQNANINNNNNNNNFDNFFSSTIDTSSTISKIFNNDGTVSNSSINLNINKQRTTSLRTFDNNRRVSMMPSSNNSNNNNNKNPPQSSIISTGLSKPSNKVKVINSDNINSTSNYVEETNEQQQKQQQQINNNKKEIKFKNLKDTVLMNVNNNEIKSQLIKRAKSLATTPTTTTTTTTDNTTPITVLQTQKNKIKSTSSSTSSIRNLSAKPPVQLVRPSTVYIGDKNKKTSTIKFKKNIKKSNIENTEYADFDDEDDYSYFSASDIVVKSKSYDNFNYKQNEVVSGRVSVASKKSQSTLQQEPTLISIREPLPQYSGRWTDMAVKCYIENNDDNDSDYETESNTILLNKLNKKPQHYNQSEYDYISNIFKIRRYNLNDVKELEKAKNDLFKRYSFVNDPYIKSRLSSNSSNLSHLASGASSFKSNMSTSSRLSIATVNDRK